MDPFCGNFVRFPTDSSFCLSSVRGSISRLSTDSKMDSTVSGSIYRSTVTWKLVLNLDSNSKLLRSMNLDWKLFFPDFSHFKLNLWAIRNKIKVTCPLVSKQQNGNRRESRIRYKHTTTNWFMNPVHYDLDSLDQCWGLTSISEKFNFKCSDRVQKWIQQTWIELFSAVAIMVPIFLNFLGAFFAI